MNIYQSITYRKNLNWLYFNNKPKIPERQQVKDKQSCISVSMVYLIYASSKEEHQPRNDNSISTKGVW